MSCRRQRACSREEGEIRSAHNPLPVGAMSPSTSSTRGEGPNGISLQRRANNDLGFRRLASGKTVGFPKNRDSRGASGASDGRYGNIPSLLSLRLGTKSGGGGGRGRIQPGQVRSPKRPPGSSLRKVQLRVQDRGRNPSPFPSHVLHMEGERRHQSPSPPRAGRRGGRCPEEWPHHPPETHFRKSTPPNNSNNNRVSMRERKMARAKKVRETKKLIRIDEETHRRRTALEDMATATINTESADNNVNNAIPNERPKQPKAQTTTKVVTHTPRTQSSFTSSTSRNVTPRTYSTSRSQSATPRTHSTSRSQSATPRTHSTSRSATPRTHSTSRSATPRTHSTSRSATPRTHSTSRSATPRTHSTSRSATPRTHSTSRIATPRTHSNSRSVTSRTNSNSRSVTSRTNSNSRSVTSRTNSNSRSVTSRTSSNSRNGTPRTQSTSRSVTPRTPSTSGSATTRTQRGSRNATTGTQSSSRSATTRTQSSSRNDTGRTHSISRHVMPRTHSTSTSRNVTGRTHSISRNVTRRVHSISQNVTRRTHFTSRNVTRRVHSTSRNVPRRTHCSSRNVTPTTYSTSRSVIPRSHSASRNAIRRTHSTSRNVTPRTQSTVTSNTSRNATSRTQFTSRNVTGRTHSISRNAIRRAHSTSRKVTSRTQSTSRNDTPRTQATSRDKNEKTPVMDTKKLIGIEEEPHSRRTALEEMAINGGMNSEDNNVNTLEKGPPKLSKAQTTEKLVTSTSQNVTPRPQSTIFPSTSRKFTPKPQSTVFPSSLRKFTPPRAHSTRTGAPSTFRNVISRTRSTVFPSLLRNVTPRTHFPFSPGSPESPPIYPVTPPNLSPSSPGWTQISPSYIPMTPKEPPPTSPSFTPNGWQNGISCTPPNRTLNTSLQRSHTFPGAVSNTPPFQRNPKTLEKCPPDEPTPSIPRPTRKSLLAKFNSVAVKEGYFTIPSQALTDRYPNIATVLGEDWIRQTIGIDEEELEKKEDILLRRTPDPGKWAIQHEGLQLCKNRRNTFAIRRRMEKECQERAGSFIEYMRLFFETEKELVRKGAPQPVEVTVIFGHILAKIESKQGVFTMNLSTSETGEK